MPTLPLDQGCAPAHSMRSYTSAASSSVKIELNPSDVPAPLVSAFTTA